MKKYITYVLLACLLLSCFAGCKQNEVTPTEVTPNNTTTTQTDLQKESVQNDSVVQKAIQQNETESIAQPNEAKDPQQTSKQSISAKPTKQENKQPASSKPTKQESKQPTSSKPTNDSAGNYDECLKSNEPTFNTEAAMQAWLKSNSAKTDHEADMLTAMSTNNIVQYCRPTLVANKDYCLSEMQLYALSKEITYQFKDTDGSHAKNKHAHCYSSYAVSITVSQCVEDNDNLKTIFDQYVNGVKNRTKGYYLQRINNIDYYYFHRTDRPQTFVVWKEHEMYHMANLCNLFDSIDQILPLLRIESIQLNSNHITQ